jgi:putative flippase GtrA
MSALVPQCLKFATAGGIATSLHYAVLILLVQAAGIDPVAASGAGFAVGAVSSYLLNYRYTFASTKSHAKAFGRFITVALVGMLLNLLIMWLCIHWLQINYLLAQVLATGLVLIWSFGANRLWTFR